MYIADNFGYEDFARLRSEIARDIDNLCIVMTGNSQLYSDGVIDTETWLNIQHHLSDKRDALDKEVEVVQKGMNLHYTPVTGSMARPNRKEPAPLTDGEKELIDAIWNRYYNNY